MKNSWIIILSALLLVSCGGGGGGGGTTYYADNDGDGFGDPSLSVVLDTQQAGYVLDSTDCDDHPATGSSIHPGAVEVCGDWTDNDCNELADCSDTLICSGDLTCSASSERITFTGGGELGIFDPSIAMNPAESRVWMSYSAVDSSQFYSTNLYWSVSIRLAYSDDNGGTWQDGGVAVAPFTENTVGPMTVHPPQALIDAGSQGIWQSETSSLIFDPGAPAGERWKLIWFQYLNADLVNYFLDYSWIAMKTAATPLELAAATPVKLFGGFGIQPEGGITAPPVYSPIASAPSVALNADLTQAAMGASLADLTYCVFAEPGLAATGTAVYLSIFCMDVSVEEENLLHFKCDSPCTMTDASQWEYLGKMLTPADAAAATGRDHYQAPAIVDRNGRNYLIATPVDTTLGNRYDGCRVYQFTDLDTSDLLRGSGGLIEVARADGQADLHNGACDYLSGLDGGIIYSQFDPAKTPETFRIYKSGVGGVP